MFSNSSQNFLSGVAWKAAAWRAEGLCYTYIEVLDIILLLDKLSEKFNIARPFLFCVKVPKPRKVVIQIEIGDIISIWIEKGFEDRLTYVLFSIRITTE